MKNLALLWDDARIFLVLARCGTLTAAGEELGLGIATISRRIERLETSVGLPLFVRHHSGYQITAEGAALVPQAEAMEEAARCFQGTAEQEQRVAGLVRVATAENLATLIVLPALGPMLQMHPLLRVEVATDVRTVNMHRQDADIALRLVRPDRGNVQVSRVGTLGYGLYGSRRYPRWKAGFDGLSTHALIGWTEPHANLPAAKWIANALCEAPPVFAASSLGCQVAAAQAGIGLAVLPHLLASQKDLIRAPVELDLDQGIWLVVHSSLASASRVRVVASTIKTAMIEHSAALEGRA